MENLKRELNEYIFLEFDLEGDESLISETWPYEFRLLGEVANLTVFEFVDDDEPFFALAGRSSLDFMAKAGMTLEDLQLQRTGSQWLGDRDPINLETSMPGEASVPSGLERQKALESLGERALGGSGVKVLEGLFLRAERRYLGLFGRPGEEDAFVVGLSTTPMLVKFPDASAWRRLAWGVGTWLQRGNE